VGAVKVTASYVLATGLLGIVGINTLHAQGTGEARPLIGVTEQSMALGYAGIVRQSG